MYDVVRKFFPSAREIGYHLPRALLPGEYSHLPLLGTVRNPWDFYVSWYHYQYSNESYSAIEKRTILAPLAKIGSLILSRRLETLWTSVLSEDKLDFFDPGVA